MQPLLRTNNHVHTYFKAPLFQSFDEEITRECQTKNLNVHDNINLQGMKQNKEYNNIIHAVAKYHLPADFNFYSATVDPTTFIINVAGNNLEQIMQIAQTNLLITDGQLIQSNYSMQELVNTIEYFKKIIKAKRWNKTVFNNFANRTYFNLLLSDQNKAYLDVNDIFMEQRFQLVNCFLDTAYQLKTLSPLIIAKVMKPKLQKYASDTINSWIKGE